jgi:transcription-repair coupling factor (superfamily II helicase)
MPDSPLPLDTKPGALVVAGAPDGADALLLGAWAAAGRTLLHVARDDARLYRLIDHLRFFHPGVETLAFPAWDTLPYDRVSPNIEIMADRASVLAKLASAPAGEAPRVVVPTVVVTTVSAILQRMPPRTAFANTTLSFKRGGSLDLEKLTAFLAAHGFNRTGTVREPGEFAVRGGLIDLFPPGAAEPVRLDLFGASIESIRGFDPLTQKTTGTHESFALAPVSELVLDEARITLFRERYRAAHPNDWRGDPLYEAVSSGQRFIGMEQWLPHFYPGLETLFHYLSGAAVTMDHQVEQAVDARLDLIADYYEARRSLAASGKTPTGEFVYRPVPPGSLYLDRAEWKSRLAERRVAAFSPFAAPEGVAGVIDAGYRQAPDFSAARNQGDVNLFDEVRETLGRHARGGARPMVAAFTAGSRARLAQLLRERGAANVQEVADWASALAVPREVIAVAELPLEHGILDGRAGGTPVAIVTEQDILGERLVRRVRKRKRTDAFITELSSLQPGDLVVHEDHGIGRYDGLETLTAGGAPHDCLRLVYAGGDKLYLPVENIELLSRYGSEAGEAALDKLGGAGWQTRKARIKQRIREIADKLIAIAALRQLKTADAVQWQPGAYDEFSAQFPYQETEDQQKAIEDVLADLASGKPMDRLVCGDVGFGKTEVALRAAFIAAMGGLQVAVVVPTTLLARQHTANFCDRFRGLPLKIGHLSRLATNRDVADTKRGLAEGDIDIVIGTHALLGKTVKFKRLGLVIVDEEQHFGVVQKERLKELRADVHVLTLTATPIPRTLQMALAGVRDLSLITTPPVDRLAVRTFVLPYDPVVIREAIQRELFRGGQIYYVCPRIEDLTHVTAEVRELAPEAKIATAHGQMAASELEDTMVKFVDGQIQILVSTNIIESGLDIPNVNTIIVHRSDRFGLAQLYQLRGRVGRSKVRAYAYLTIPPSTALSEDAQRRLEVMQMLDQLGAGFQLASHDMDIRGAGNLLGEEQSGHIKEVGIELYQQMLEEAVATARESGPAGLAAPEEERWTPQISIGMPVLIPEEYVADLSVRLGLYRRIADLIEARDIDAFAAELVDRFGPLPDEVKNLLDLVAIKRFCVTAGIEKIDAGPKGAVIAFRANTFAKPEKLVHFIKEQAGTMKVRPDQRIVYRRDWRDERARLRGVNHLVKSVAALAA